MLQRQSQGVNKLCRGHTASRGLCLPAAAVHAHRRPHTSTAQRRRSSVVAAAGSAKEPKGLGALQEAFKSGSVSLQDLEDASDALDVMLKRLQAPIKLPVAQPGQLEQIQSSQAAAEAAQQALMSEGKLAEAAAGNEVLRSILQSWATVQRAYHRALQPMLERHAEYAGSPTGGWCQRDPSDFDVCCSSCHPNNVSLHGQQCGQPCTHWCTSVSHTGRKVTSPAADTPR
jgi:hypothetical protein